MSQESVIVVSNLSKTYRVWKSPEARLQSLFWNSLGRLEKAQSFHQDFAVLSDINFDIGRGQSLGIIGLNGAGKSTLLQIIAGTLQPTTGDVRIRGRVAALLELGAGFNPDFTGRENVYLNASVLGLTREETDARFNAIAAFADIGDYIEQPVKTYSSGMYVRLAFAVLTQVQPDVLIIDEALAVGDFVFQQKCFDVMRQFRKQGVTFIFVSHGMGMVLDLCERAIVLDRGRILFDGAAQKAVAVYEENAVRSRYGGTALAPHTDNDMRQSDRHGGSPETRPSAYVLKPNVDPTALQKEPGSIHTSKVTLLFARFLDESYAEKLHFRTGENMIISLGFDIHSSLADPHAGFKIRDKMGRVIFETSSLCMRQSSGSVHSGETFIANFSVHLPLIDGEYSLVVGFSEGAVSDRDYREALFYVQHVRTFTILPSEADIIWTGICHLNPKFGWSIVKGGDHL